ncbi:MAG: MogA/MoaB family molybdenum cofactor biosynthesis protein [Acidobacteria bacterium]|jgi:molybdenum cofactor synthesis domain-containing protein|nr:MogA/MoaB family molybdenum cofactor biosynthesis protein [Acidobacteriota bacterium]
MADNEKIRAVVVTVSDTRRETDDVSGALLVELLSEMGAQIVDKIIVSDEFEDLRQTLYALCARGDANLILTCGGTGFAPRDNTPEATRAVIEREASGLAEAMRYATLKNTPTAILSRGVCGIRGKTLIINLPGSPKAVRECFVVIEPVLQHAVNLISGVTKHNE